MSQFNYDYEVICNELKEEIKSLKEENKKLRALCYFNIKTMNHLIKP